MVLKKRMQMTCEIDVPEGVSLPELRRYVQEALATWGGGGDPEAPLFAGVKARKIQVSKYKLVNVREWHA